MKITLIRKGSKGLEGTLENAKHHAVSAIPLIKILKNMIKRIGFEEWKQGHNIHVVKCHNENQIQFTPYMDEEENFGIRIGLYVSRKQRIPLGDFTDKSQTPIIESLLYFLCHELKENHYMCKKN